MVVGFLFSQLGLGEIAIGFEAFYAIKKIYNAKLVVFGQECMKNLLEYCNFVDLCLPTQADDINSQNVDYLILSNSKSWFINFAKGTNAKYIICATKITSLFSIKCKTVPIYFCKKYENLDERELLLSYVRKINPNYYDSKINMIDLSQAKIAYTKTHKQFVLSQIQDKVQNLTNTADKVFLILVNPFNKACPYSLHLNKWIELARKIARKVPKETENMKLIPIIATYPQVHEQFMKTIKKENLDTKDIIIFENNDDLLNLVCLISQTSIVISPSTGAIHVACNQRIPTIGVYPKHDTRRWATHNKKYIFLEKPLNEISQSQEIESIEQILKMLESMLSQHEIAPVNLKSN